MTDLFRRESIEFIDQTDQPGFEFGDMNLRQTEFLFQDGNHLLHLFFPVLSRQFSLDAVAMLQPVRFGTELCELVSQGFQLADFIAAQHSFFKISASSTWPKCSTSWLKVFFFFIVNNCLDCL